MKYKVALLFQRGNFVAREYYSALLSAGYSPDLLVSVGCFSAQSHAREVERTGGLWNPVSIPEQLISAHFEKSTDKELLDFLKANQVDVVIQGGVGILKKEFITAFPVGIINVHPGLLPQYRGNSCPEWAVYNGDEVWATAHFIDQGIDTGPVILTGRYQYPAGITYHQFRANLYKHNAEVLVEAMKLIQMSSDTKVLAKKQNESLACYYQPMGQDEFQLMLNTRFSK